MKQSISDEILQTQGAFPSALYNQNNKYNQEQGRPLVTSDFKILLQRKLRQSDHRLQLQSQKNNVINLNIIQKQKRPNSQHKAVFKIIIDNLQEEHKIKLLNLYQQFILQIKKKKNLKPKTQLMSNKRNFALIGMYISYLDKKTFQKLLTKIKPSQKVWKKDIKRNQIKKIKQQFVELINIAIEILQAHQKNWVNQYNDKFMQTQAYKIHDQCLAWSNFLKDNYNCNNQSKQQKAIKPIQDSKQFQDQKSIPNFKSQYQKVTLIQQQMSLITETTYFSSCQRKDSFFNQQQPPQDFPY